MCTGLLNMFDTSTCVYVFCTEVGAIFVNIQTFSPPSDLFLM